MDYKLFTTDRLWVYTNFCTSLYSDVIPLPGSHRITILETIWIFVKCAPILKVVLDSYLAYLLAIQYI